jgi:hypothetical protein
MMNDTRIKAERIVDAAGREAALAVLGATYRNEKGWIADPAQQFPADDLTSNGIDWFIVCFNGAPAGVLRTLYDPQLLQYSKYGLKLLDGRFDIEAFL